MSKKNVALFIEAIAKKRDLNAQLAGAKPELSAWTQVANAAGFQFSDDDLHVVLQKVLDRQVGASSIVSEFVAAQSDTTDRAVSSTTPLRVEVSPTTIQKINVISGIGESAGEWGLHVKGPFSGTPGGTQQR